MSDGEKTDEDDVNDIETEVVGVPTVVKFEGQEAALGKSPEDLDEGEYEQLVPPSKSSEDSSEDS